MTIPAVSIALRYIPHRERTNLFLSSKKIFERDTNRLNIGGVHIPVTNLKKHQRSVTVEETKETLLSLF